MRRHREENETVTLTYVLQATKA